MRLEARQVVDRALAVRRRDHERGIGTDFARHSGPRRLNRRDGIRQRSILRAVGVFECATIQREVR